VWTREQSNQAQHLRMLGMSVTEIAEKFGYSRVQVSKWLSRDFARKRKYGASAIEQNPRSRCIWTTEESDRAVNMYREGKSVSEIAKAVLRTDPAVFSFLRKQGISVKKPIVMRPLKKFEMNRVERDDLIRRGLFRTNRMFLVDLLVASGLKTLGEAKAAYVAKNELCIEEGPARSIPMTWFEGSVMGSAADMCVG
jgi:transposase-like protein